MAPPPRRRGRALTRAIALALAAALLAGCASSGASSEASARGWRDGTVAIVGDSMMFETASDFERLAAQRGWDVSIVAVPGTTFAARRADLTALRARFASAVIVELGTNDALHDGDFTASEAADIDRTVTTLDRVGCVLFVNAGLLEPRNQDVLLRPPWDDYAPGLHAAQALNRHLAAAVHGHANVHLFDWFAAYNSHPEWTRDFVHLKAEHQADYARLVLDALSDACGPGTTRS